MTNAQRRALGEKRFNCIRAIHKASEGLQTACQAAGRIQGRQAALKAIQERAGRIAILTENLATLNEQLIETE